MKLPIRFLKYLQNKLRGGEINQRGNTYENYFVVYRIASIANTSPFNLQSIYISSQATAFVDDLFIYDAVQTNYHYYQLKTSKALVWGKGFKSIAFDFNIQRRIELFEKHFFKLFLIVSFETLQNALSSSLPKKIKSCTEVQLFPYYESIPKQIANDQSFKLQLENLCAFQDSDKLEALATIILGAWNASDKKQIPIAQILNKVRSIGYSYLKISVPLFLQQDTHQILTSIPGFSYEISGGYLEYNYAEADHGTVRFPLDSEEFRNIEKEINLKKPTTFQDLEQIII